MHIEDYWTAYVNYKIIGKCKDSQEANFHVFLGKSKG